MLASPDQQYLHLVDLQTHIAAHTLYVTGGLLAAALVQLVIAIFQAKNARSQNENAEKQAKAADRQAEVAAQQTELATKALEVSRRQVVLAVASSDNATMPHLNLVKVPLGRSPVTTNPGVR
jgi:uncharacterized protein YlxW (UPF0749 family)